MAITLPTAEEMLEKTIRKAMCIRDRIDIYNLEKALEQIKHEMKTLNEKVEDYGDH